MVARLAMVSRSNEKVEMVASCAAQWLRIYTRSTYAPHLTQYFSCTIRGSAGCVLGLIEASRNDKKP
eukprot:m.71930 g.71930  ORF g.71930 m.71930 type:complete len:67 (+) comp10088_c0_seq2:918-1118(+)